MNRRDLLKHVALLTGTAVVGGDFMLTGCGSPAKETAPEFTAADLALLDEVGETIIPATDTPGAKAIHIGEFMKLIVTDCYTEKQQSVFKKGIADLELTCERMHGKSFVRCDGFQRKEFLIGLEKEAKTHDQLRGLGNKAADAHQNLNQDESPSSRSDGFTNHYYTMMKQLTLLGFFTSEPGMTQTLRHVAVPGRYDGEAPYTKGERAWAE